MRESGGERENEPLFRSALPGERGKEGGREGEREREREKETHQVFKKREKERVNSGSKGVPLIS